MQGVKAHWMPVAFTSSAVMRSISSTSVALRVAPRPMHGGSGAADGAGGSGQGERGEGTHGSGRGSHAGLLGQGYPRSAIESADRRERMNESERVALRPLAHRFPHQDAALSQIARLSAE